MSETMLSSGSATDKRMEYFPLMMLFFFASTASFALWSGAFLLGIHPKIEYLITTWCIVFGIYGINRYTDIEDFINDSPKMEFFAGKRIYLYFSIAILIGSVLWLLAAGSLKPFHVLCVYSGIAYSFPIIPWITKGRAVRWLRLKEITFVKSFLVAFLVGTSFFALYLDEAGIAVSRIELTALMIGSALSMFINTVFCDIRDLVGDKAAGVKTIPVLLNLKPTMVYCIAVPSVTWFSAAITLYLLSLISTPVLIFLVCTLLYPALYIGLYYKKLLPDRISFLIADSCVLAFAFGLITLKFCLP